jgi:hypothetical protein
MEYDEYNLRKRGLVTARLRAAQNCTVATRRGVNATQPAIETTTSAPTTTAMNKGVGGGKNPNKY